MVFVMYIVLNVC